MRSRPDRFQTHAGACPLAFDSVQPTAPRPRGPWRHVASSGSAPGRRPRRPWQSAPLAQGACRKGGSLRSLSRSPASPAEVAWSALVLDTTRGVAHGPIRYRGLAVERLGRNFVAKARTSVCQTALLIPAVPPRFKRDVSRSSRTRSAGCGRCQQLRATLTRQRSRAWHSPQRSLRRSIYRLADRSTAALPSAMTLRPGKAP